MKTLFRKHFGNVFIFCLEKYFLFGVKKRLENDFTRVLENIYILQSKKHL